MKKPNVLVADQQAIIALDLRKTLERWNFNVVQTFRTGEELLKFAQADDPDILIMDTFLAGELDGFETAKEVLKTNKIPVIFMTGQDHQKYKDEVSIGGKYTYLHKPFSEAQLKEKLDQFFPGYIKEENGK